MSNNNRKEPPFNPAHIRYPQKQQPNPNPAINPQHHHPPNQFYHQNQYPYPHQRPPTFQPPTQRQIEQMSRHNQTYNQQMQYNNYYYQQQQYMPPPYPHYPPPSSPYPNNYQQYRPQTPPNYNSYNQSVANNRQSKNQQPYAEQKNYSPKDNKSSYHKEEKTFQSPSKQQKESYNTDNRKRDNRQSEKSGSEDNEQNDMPQIVSSSDEQSEEQQVIYRRKAIVKKKDPVLDSRQQIRKWVEARKRNYPKRTLTTEQAQVKVDQSEISILQKKIRKKILLINADPRSMMKKLKDIDILRRFILYSRKNKKTNIPARPNLPRINTPTKQQYQPTSKTVIQQPQIQILPKSEDKIPQEQNEQLVVQMPIKSEKPLQIIEQHQHYARRDDLSVDVIIKHLQMKQAEDTKTLQNLMDYKSNSFHYRYQHQTLETNLLLQNIFSQTSYLLQAIRFIVKNNFFDEKKPQE